MRGDLPAALPLALAGLTTALSLLAAALLPSVEPLPLPGDERASPGDTAAHDWVWFRGTPAGPPFPKPERRARVSGDEMLFVYRAVVAGIGVGLLPSFLATPDVSAGRLVRLIPRYALSTGALYFVHASGTKPPRKVLAFRDYVAEYIAAHPLCPGTA